MNRISITALIGGLSLLILCVLLTAAQSRAHDFEAFYLGGDEDLVEPFRTQGNGWTSTSSGFSGLGRPATLTWSVVPEGTSLPGNFLDASGSTGGVNTPSNLISFLDGIHHGGTSPGGSDLTQRAWWGLMNSAFERWDALSGIAYSYEPEDDGRPVGPSSASPGVLGTRGDHRISGHPLDGQTSPTILAYNYFPNIADMVIDTDEINRWGNASNNFRLFRNMMMHEIAHGFGLQHVESFDVVPSTPSFQFGTFLMEPILASRFDGPQFDDILGAHRLYGDINEEGAGNETHLTATPLGSILTGQTISIGTDAVDLSVGPDEVDFVSIDDNSDVDFFRFSITGPQVVDIRLTPLGPTYDEGPQGSGENGTQQPFVASAKSDLILWLYDTDGTSLLEFSNETGLGQSEEIEKYHLSAAGDYFIRVGGGENAAQFFQLDVTIVPEPTSLILLAMGSAGWMLSRRAKNVF